VSLENISNNRPSIGESATDSAKEMLIVWAIFWLLPDSHPGRKTLMRSRRNTVRMALFFKKDRVF
jgi:hypothetical protein